MKRTFQLALAAAVALATTATAMAVPFTGSYTQNFDSMGTAGTAAPTGWTEFSLSGSHDQFRHAGSTAAITTTVLPSDFSDSIVNGHAGLTLTNNTTLTVATASNQKSAGGFNFANAAAPSDRALGTSPTGVAATELQLTLTNGGSATNTLAISYDIRRFSTTVDTNGYTTSPDFNVEELPGYWLFYSLDNGTSWTNVAALNPTLSGPGGVLVPNTVGVTSVPTTTFTLNGTWASGSNLLLRWFDDNAQSPSPDQLLGLDNVVISTPEPTSLAMLSAAGLFLLRRKRSI